MAGNIKDPSLGPAGGKRIDWAASWAPVMNRIRDRLIEEGSVRGRRIGIILPVEPKTAYLSVILAQAGAQVTLSFVGSMVLDDVAAGAAERGVEVFARSDSTPEQEREQYTEVLARRPEVVIDDRAELIRMAHTTHKEALDHLLGASEETTTGVVALRAMEAEGILKVPCMAANDARCKYLFDNRYGTGQSCVQAVLDSTNLVMAGKTLVVVGYGWVGKGVARRARGMGARVIVAEVEPFAALEAYHDGYAIAPLLEACEQADIVMTCTGVREAMPQEGIDRLRNGAILANTGAVDDEFDMAKLRARALDEREVRPNVVEYELDEGRSVYVVGDGMVVNLTAGEGHPIEIMDLTFSVQALSARHLLLNADKMEPKVHILLPEIDEEIARNKLDALGLRIDQLTSAQQEFLRSWEVPA